MDKVFVSLAVLKAKKDKVKALREALLAMIEPTRKEQGCIEYILFEDADSPDTFYMREAFDNEAAFNFHVSTPHFKNLVPKLDELLAEPLKLIKLNKVSS